MKNLLRALLKAQESIVGVEKKSTNKFSNYDYVSAEDMVKSARKALLESGIVSGRKSWSYESDKVRSTFFLSHPESGECLEATTEFPAVARKGTPEDKALATALTSSLSYFLRDILLLPRFPKNENMDYYTDKHETDSDIQKRILG